MPRGPEIVVTGVGVASPIGIGKEAFWKSLCEGRSGIRRFHLFDRSDLPPVFGGSVPGFHPKQYVRPRKSLKVMNRDIQLAFAAADLACADAGLHRQPVEPERLGIVFGAELMACELDEIAGTYRGCMVEGRFDFRRWGKVVMAELYPLWMLKYLPNMPACHIGIAQDARGPTNTLTLGEVSSVSAMAEAMRVIGRGQADVMIAGGTAEQIHPAIWTRSPAFPFSRSADDPARASRPFDARRDGWVNGEGAGALVLEGRRHAEARGATVLARILGFGSAFEPHAKGQPIEGRAIRQAIRTALADADLTPADIGHVNANGVSTLHDDRIEARAICEILGDVPVTAPKSYFGMLGAAAGAVETAVSVLAWQHGLIPPTLNYEYPDPECPVNVVHGQPAPVERATALKLNHTRHGQAVALVLGGAE
jgi:3-oxoacyl-[acyl-carrier-protein] synthase II